MYTGRRRFPAYWSVLAATLAVTLSLIASHSGGRSITRQLRAQSALVSDGDVFTQFLPLATIPMSQLAFVSDRTGNDEIYVMNVDGTQLSRLTFDESRDWAPAWSPDGNWIAFTSDRDGDDEIFIMKADRTELRQLTNNDGFDCCADWSPDGTKIAFNSNWPQGDQEIYVINVDGTGRVNLTNSTGDDWSPDWSRGGEQIVFDARRDGQAEIYIMNADGSDQRRLTRSFSAQRGAAYWAPRQFTAYIFYQSNELLQDPDGEGDENIYRMDLDGSNQIRLTDNSVNDMWPDLHGSSSRMVFTSERDGQQEIYTMNADGNMTRRITFNPASDYGAVWRPLSGTIVPQQSNDWAWEPVGNGAATDGGISMTSSPSVKPALVASPDGFIYAAWSEELSEDHSEIYVLRWNGARWMEVGPQSASQGGISNTPGRSLTPRLATSIDGYLYVTWHEKSGSNSEIYVKRWDGSNWGDLAASAVGGGVSNTPDNSVEPDIAVGSNNIPYVVWQEELPTNNEIYVRYWIGSDWAEVGISSASGRGISNNDGDSGNPSIVIVDNVPWVAWSDASGGPDTEVYVRYWNGSAWVESGTGSATGGGMSNNDGASRGPVLAAVSGEEVYAAWPDNSGGLAFNIYVRRWNGSSWEEIGARSASNHGISHATYNTIAPEIAIGTDNVPYITWYSPATAEVYVRHWNGLMWEELGAGSASGPGISDSPGKSNHPAITIGLGNIPYVAWADETNGNSEIYIKRWTE